MKAKLNKRN